MDPADRWLALARQTAYRSEQEQAEALRNCDPALGRALEEVLRIRFGLLEPEDEG